MDTIKLATDNEPRELIRLTSMQLFDKETFNKPTDTAVLLEPPFGEVKLFFWNLEKRKLYELVGLTQLALGDFVKTHYGSTAHKVDCEVSFDYNLHTAMVMNKTGEEDD